MNRVRIPSSLIFAALVIPTQSMKGWHLEAYSRIPSNEVATSEKGMLIHVQKSASPLMYQLPTTEHLTGFKVSGEFRGLPKLPITASEGEKGADDFALRIGFIVPGEKKLSGVKRLLAPQWIKRLYEQVPPGLGLDSIHFFNVTQNVKKVGQERVHPKSDLILENFFAAAETPGPFSYTHTLKKPIDAIAIWVSVDGDDTKSEYDVLLAKLELTTSTP